MYSNMFLDENLNMAITLYINHNSGCEIFFVFSLLLVNTPNFLYLMFVVFSSL